CVRPSLRAAGVGRTNGPPRDAGKAGKAGKAGNHNPAWQRTATFTPGQAAERGDAALLALFSELFDLSAASGSAAHRRPLGRGVRTRSLMERCGSRHRWLR
ncbi:MAG: hypothetical protein ACR2KP_07080, partial [Egibacteraceae bacterium]